MGAGTARALVVAGIPTMVLDEKESTAGRSAERIRGPLPKGLLTASFLRRRPRAWGTASRWRHDGKILPRPTW